VICGGGIVGASTAYFLTAGSHHRRGGGGGGTGARGSGPGPAPRAVDVTLVERHEIAGAASGKAGGFLALDWSDGTPVRRHTKSCMHFVHPHPIPPHPLLIYKNAPPTRGRRRSATN
jgi:glycine/D-amino acid oxidase-like deaminating enzyme